jgi:hypothetical protein
MANGEWISLFVDFSIRHSPFAIRLRLQVEVEEGGVEFRAEQKATLLVPAERRPGVPAVPRERLQVPRRVGSSRTRGRSESVRDDNVPASHRQPQGTASRITI